MNFYSTVYVAALAGCGLATCAPVHAGTVGQVFDLEFSTGAAISSWGTQSTKQVTSTKVTTKADLDSYSVCRFYYSFKPDICGEKPVPGASVETTRTVVVNPTEIKGSIRETASWDKSVSVGGILGTNGFFVDTRTGAKATLQTDGEAGIQIDYTVSAGTINPQVTYAAQVYVPDANSIAQGESFNLSAGSQITSGTLNAQAPTAKLSVDAILDINAKVTGKACFTPFGCASGSDSFGISDSIELLSITPAKIVYLDGILPTGVSLEQPLGNSTTKIVQSGSTGQLQLVYANGTTDPVFVPPPTRDVAALKLTIPEVVKTRTTVVGNEVRNTGRSDFLDLTVDLDGLAQLPLSGNIFINLPSPIPNVTGRYDLIDIDLGPSLGFKQSYALASDLMVNFVFDQFVQVAGQGLVKSFTGAWNSLPDMAVFEETVFMPFFWLESDLTSKANFDLSLKMNVSILSGELEGFDIGPLYKKSFPTDSVDFDLVDRTFDFNGFNTIAGSSFVVSPYSVKPLVMASVPLPMSGVLLFTSLGALGMYRRKVSARQTA